MTVIALQADLFANPDHSGYHAGATIQGRTMTTEKPAKRTRRAKAELAPKTSEAQRRALAAYAAKKREEGVKPVNFKLPKEVLDQLSLVVERGEYPSRHAAIVDMIAKAAAKLADKG